jgi:hypothetical protein
MGRRNQKPKRDPNLIFRHTYIQEADRIMADCPTYTSDSVETSDTTRRRWRRAAKLYERAADFYRRAGLGIMVIRSWEEAEKCFAALRMPDDRERCRLKSVSIPIYYEEDNDERA